MVTNYNTDINQRIISALKLQSSDGIPNNVSNQIVPVLNINEIGVLKGAQFNSTTNAITITVPNDRRWLILWATSNYAASATVGNRNFRCLVNDKDGNGQWDVYRAVSGVASTTYRTLWSSSINVPTEITTPVVKGFVPLPPNMILDSGSTFKIYDSANIDVADTSNVYLKYIEFSTGGI